MGVDDAADVRPRAIDLGVYEHLGVPRVRAPKDLAVEIDELEILGADLLEPETGRLHPERLRAWHARAGMAPHVVALARHRENATGVRQPPLQRRFAAAARRLPRLAHGRPPPPGMRTAPHIGDLMCREFRMACRRGSNPALRSRA